jgi:16S rRNA (adenine1518-N6/adenine1519-N6)-dimethyltransferase
VVPGPTASADGLLGPGDVRALAAGLSLRPTRQRGQNFVIDANTIRRIVIAARLDPDDVVLEVGPGLGSLTLGLLGAAARVVAVEIEPALAQTLSATVAERLPEAAGRLTVLQADALSVRVVPGDQPTALVANLPYNIAVPVLLTLLAALPSITKVLVLVQQEVADRLAAGPGSKTYGVPSVKAAWYGDVENAGRIGRMVFWPAPNVDSGLVRLTRREPPGDEALRLATFAVVDAAFGMRRKTLRGSLAGLAGSPTESERLLRVADVDPGLRGEALDLAAFARIGRAFADLPGRREAAVQRPRP